MRIHHQLTYLGVVLTCFAAVEAVHGAEISSPSTANVLQQFEVSKDREELILPVSFRGRTYDFILDTGSDLTIYDSIFREQLGHPIRTSRTKTPNGEFRVDLFRSPSAKLGELDMQTHLPVMCMDLSKVRQATGYDVYGMIGMDFLRDHVVQINLDRGQVSFLRSTRRDAGRPVRIFYRSLHPCVVAEVAGITATFAVDTGCSQSGNVDTNIFDQLVERQRVSAIGSTQTTSLSGIKNWRIGRVDTIVLDEFKHQDLILSEAQGNQLGLAYLSRFVVTFDFPNDTMYLKRGQRFDIVDRRDMSGLHILHDRGNVVVHSVDEGSPAAVAGIRQHDVIMTIAGRTAQQYELAELRRMLKPEGRWIEMTIERDGRKMPATFQLNEWRQTAAGNSSRRADFPHPNRR